MMNKIFEALSMGTFYVNTKDITDAILLIVSLSIAGGGCLGHDRIQKKVVEKLVDDPEVETIVFKNLLLASVGCEVIACYSLMLFIIYLVHKIK